MALGDRIGTTAATLALAGVASVALAVGNVWLADGSNAVTVIETDQTPVSAFALGSGAWQGIERVGLQVWAVDGTDTVSRFTLAGEPIDTFAVPDYMFITGIRGVAPVGDEVWLVGTQPGFVRYSTDGVRLGAIVDNDTPRMDGIAQVDDVVWGVTGAQPGSGDVFVFDLDGTQIDRFTPNSTGDAWAGITVVGTEVWMARSDETVFRFTHNGTQLGHFEPGALNATWFGLAYTGTCPGDVSCDGVVDVTDLNLVLAWWGQSVPPADPNADQSGDGSVGVDDLNIVLSRWATACP